MDYQDFCTIPITELGERLLTEENLLREIIAHPQSEPAQAVLKAADRLRALTVGEEVHLRGLIEFSNYCRGNCNYCGLRRDNRQAFRYRLTQEEILAAATLGARLGYRTVVLQSGEDPAFTGEGLAEIIKEIKKLGLVVTLSVGERPRRDYELWREAGAERYLIRHETADLLLYARLHPGRSLKERLDCVQILKDLDYQVGMGFMVGLPGQTPATLVEDLRLIRRVNAEMVGIGPYIPHPETPLAGCPGGTMEQTVLMVALARLVLPHALIPATTALGSINPKGREAALQAGANVVMPNLTPTQYRTAYEIYPNKICTGEEAGECRRCITGRIVALGRRVSDGPGHNSEWLKRRGRGEVVGSSGAI